MTTDEFIAQQQAKIDEIVKFNIPLMIAVRNVMAAQSRRIFLEGKNSKGEIIGSYKQKGIYISEKWRRGTNLPDFPLNGKPKTRVTSAGQIEDVKSTDKKVTVYDINSKKKRRINIKDNGHDRASGYFTSFLAFKKVIGRNKRINSVDLFLTGELHRHWANSDVVGKAESKKISPHHYYVSISELDVKKVERYKDVFNLSVQEKQLFLKSLTNEFRRALK